MSIEVSISKRLGKSFRLDVNFRSDDACLGILGPSGCGKSMTLKCIAGVETPDRGRIVLNGRVLFDSEQRINLKPQQRRVGFLFQNYALFPRMTVEQNIGIGADAPPREKKRRVEELIRGFQLEGMERRYPDQLSGGQRQRVALARMLAANPEIILLDEPFSALDTHLREQMQMRLLNLFQGFRDAILVTHSRDEAYRLCQELLVLDRGCMLGRGTARDLFASPGHVRVARLTGCRNISRLKKIGPEKVYALDWGLELRAAGPVPGDAAFVGIRAHDLTPVHHLDADADNLVAMRILRRTEDPFEWNVIFANAAGSSSEQGEIWWKVSKYLPGELPGYLRLPPEALLFLHGDADAVDNGS